MIPRRAAALLLLALAASSSGTAQTTAPPPQPGQSQAPAYTFHAAARVVLTDVTVQDARGNPIHGLPVAAFHLTDNNNPQPIATFEEHTAVAPAPPAAVPVAARGTYSNDYLLHLPPVINVVLIDIANINIPDQMYLNYELTRFLNKLPAGESLAVYLRAGNGCFLLQNFTSDRTQLLNAVHKAIPRFPPYGREYLSDIETLHEMAVYLRDLPGRKNILWFTGGSTAYLNEEALDFQNRADMRGIYDELQTERIALYPIDARGLTVRSGRVMWDQHADMNEAAITTGGLAFYDNNGLDLIASRVVSTDASYYTLTYAPHDLHYDNKWHKVKVTVDGSNYRLSYRRGYFADGSLGTSDENNNRPRTRLLANGEKHEEAPYNLPIIFQATVLPASDPAIEQRVKASAVIAADPPQHGTHPISVRYSLPVASLSGTISDGKRHFNFGLAAIVLNREGRPVQRRMETVTMSAAEDQVRNNPTAAIAVDQLLNIHKDDEFLFLAVWDKTTSRAGILQVNLDPKAWKK